MLVELKGIGNLKNMLGDLIFGKLREEVALFPMGIPVNDITAHSNCCAFMIGNVWKHHKNLKIEDKWTFIGTFNVM
jgi:hypothetical protein